MEVPPSQNCFSECPGFTIYTCRENFSRAPRMQGLRPEVLEKFRYTGTLPLPLLSSYFPYFYSTIYIILYPAWQLAVFYIGQSRIFALLATTGYLHPFWLLFFFADWRRKVKWMFKLFFFMIGHTLIFIPMSMCAEQWYMNGAPFGDTGNIAHGSYLWFCSPISLS